MTDYSSAAGYAGRSSNALLTVLFGGGVLNRLPAEWNGMISGLMVIARFYLALPFLNSGIGRINSWSSQSFLFEFEHPLPLLPPTLAAQLTTGLELLLPVLLVIGLLGRLAALGLAVMSAVILLVIGGAFALPAEQIPWIAVGLLIALAGPGWLSVDYAIRKATGDQSAAEEPGGHVAIAVVSLFLGIVLLEKADVINWFGNWVF